MSAEKMQHITAQLNKMMLAKCKQPMDIEMRRVWLEYLMPLDEEDVCNGIDMLIKEENPWPEVSTVIKYAKEHKNKVIRIALQEKYNREELEFQKSNYGRNKELTHEG